jgi:hypothetical protein
MEKYNYKIPSTITHLVLGTDFSELIDIPDSIIYLKYGNKELSKKDYQTNIIEELNNRGIK